MSQNDKPAPRSKKPRTEDSAGMVWLKLAGLLVGLSAFCALIYFLSRLVSKH